MYAPTSSGKFDLVLHRSIIEELTCLDVVHVLLSHFSSTIMTAEQKRVLSFFFYLINRADKNWAHSFKKQCLHDPGLTQESGTFTKPFS